MCPLLSISRCSSVTKSLHRERRTFSVGLSNNPTKQDSRHIFDEKCLPGACPNRNPSRNGVLKPPGCRVLCRKIFLASQVSTYCKRCDFCFHLNVTLHMLFFSCSQTTDEEGVPSKRLVNIYNLCAQISIIFHPFYCAGQFLRIFVTMCM